MLRGRCCQRNGRASEVGMLGGLDDERVLELEGFLLVSPVLGQLIRMLGLMWWL